MKAILISYLHIGRREYSYYEARINSLCKFIRAKINERLLIFVLGDIIEGGTPEHFSVASQAFNLLKSNLAGYDYEIFFLPGNHDYCSGTRDDFDSFLQHAQAATTFSSGVSSASYEMEEFNFIFWDSICDNNYKSPGYIDIDEVSSKVKHGKHNVLFMHHSMLFEDDGTHTGIVNAPARIAQLQKLGIAFVFHGHAHETHLYTIEQSLFLIGVGPFSMDTSDDFDNSNHQFNLVNISGSHIQQITNYRFFGDLNEYHPHVIYPMQPSYANPSEIARKTYDYPENYFSRRVLPYALAEEDEWKRYFDRSQEVPIISACKKNKRIILISDAGMGKSTELKQLSAIFSAEQKRKFPFHVDLSLYNGGAVKDMLPTEYQTLNPALLILILDGYDEAPDQYKNIIRQQLKSFAKDNPDTQIILSMRSVFVQSSADLLSDFQAYKLLELESADIKSHLKRANIEEKQFFEECNLKGLTRLLSVPFYLTAITKIYAANRSLPNETEIIDHLISDTIDEDKNKFKYKCPDDLSEDEYELKNMLKCIAVGTQLLNKTYLTSEEFQALFPKDKRQLAELSSLLSRQGENYSFSHNNFREYLVAQHLSALSLNEILNYITLSDNCTFDIRWANILSYLVLLRKNDDLLSWLIEHEPLALVKFEVSRVSDETRFQILSQLLDRIKNDNTWLDRELCNEKDLAIFCQSPQAIDLLISEIDAPTHFRAQYFALSVVGRLQNLFGKEQALREALQRCYRHAETRPHERHEAVCALGWLSLDTQAITKEVIERFALSEDDYDRLGAYEYLTETKQIDENIEVFLSGYSLSCRRSGSGVDAYKLHCAMKSVSKASAIVAMLNWFSKNIEIDNYRSEEILSHVCAEAAKRYEEGHPELYEAVENLFVAAINMYCHTYFDAALDFFNKTQTLERFFVQLLQQVDMRRKPSIINRIIEKDDSLAGKFLSWYEEDLYDCKITFEYYTSWLNGGSLHFDSFSKAIYKKTGNSIEKRESLDYESKRRQGQQRYFDSLFDIAKSEELLKGLIQIYGDENLTFEQLKEIAYTPQEEEIPGVQELRFTLMREKHTNELVSEFFSCINWNSYAHSGIYNMLRRDKDDVVISPEQMDYIRAWFETLLKSVDLISAIKHEEDNSISYTWESVYLLALWKRFQFYCPKSFYLDLLSMHAFITEIHSTENKC